MARNFGSTCVAIVCMFTTFACSTDAIEGPAEMHPEFARAALGVYDLSFWTVGGVEVTSLPLGNPVVLRAHVTDAFGVPAQTGTVTFQYCSLKGLPTGDVTRIDEAPLSACASGAARWRSLGSSTVDASGNASFRFPTVNFTPAIGFRFRYAGRGSSVASSVSIPENFYWE